MKTRKLGDRLEVSALGYGAMVLEGSYGAIDRKAAETALGHALERGMTLIDTADVYGDGENERLVGRALAQRVTEAVVSTKWGFARPGPSARRVETSYATDVWIDARPERARIAAAASLSRLGIEAIALWYLHFPDPGIPIEETVGAMASLVKEGAVLHLGLSNVTSDELRRACQVHPIAAVQVEWSLWTREPERALVPAARELGVGVVAWGPLGGGFFGSPLIELEPDDFRHGVPRFEPANLARNKERFSPLLKLAGELGVTPAQLALGWLLSQNDSVVPIPGSRSIDHIDENAAAADIHLAPETRQRISELAPPGLAAGPSLLACASS